VVDIALVVGEVFLVIEDDVVLVLIALVSAVSMIAAEVVCAVVAGVVSTFALLDLGAEEVVLATPVLVVDVTVFPPITKLAVSPNTPNPKVIPLSSCTG
jgi:hypothetical protein